MSESRDNKEKNKNNITQSQLALVFAALAILMVYVLFKSPIHPAVGAFGFCMMFSMTAFVLGLISLLSKKNQSSKIEKALAIFSMAIPVIIFIWILYLIIQN